MFFHCSLWPVVPCKIDVEAATHVVLPKCVIIILILRRSITEDKIHTFLALISYNWWQFFKTLRFCQLRAILHTWWSLLEERSQKRLSCMYLFASKSSDKAEDILAVGDSKGCRWRAGSVGAVQLWHGRDSFAQRSLQTSSSPLFLTDEEQRPYYNKRSSWHALGTIGENTTLWRQQAV